MKTDLRNPLSKKWMLTGDTPTRLVDCKSDAEEYFILAHGWLNVYRLKLKPIEQLIKIAEELEYFDNFSDSDVEILKPLSGNMVLCYMANGSFEDIFICGDNDIPFTLDFFELGEYTK